MGGGIGEGMLVMTVATGVAATAIGRARFSIVQCCLP